MFFKVFQVCVLLSLGIVFTSCPSLEIINIEFDTAGPALLADADQAELILGDIQYGIRFDEPIKLSDQQDSSLTMAVAPANGGSGLFSLNLAKVMVDESDSTRLIITFPDDYIQQKEGKRITFTIPAGYLTDEVDNSNTKEIKHEVTDTLGVAGIGSFRFLQQDNSFLVQDVWATIKDTSITVVLPSEASRELVASFNVPEGATVKAGTTDQESGFSSNDFSGEVTYTVTALGGTSKTYTVKITDEDTPPAPPTGVTVAQIDTEGNEVKVSWQKSANHGTVSGVDPVFITKYRVYWAENSAVDKIASSYLETANGETTTLSISSLTSGSRYTFAVTAFNNSDTALNESDLSSPETFTPQQDKPPSAPTNIGFAAGLGQVTVSWDVPIDLGWSKGVHGTIPTYKVYYSTSPGFSITDSNIFNKTTGSSVLSLNIDGLDSSTYYFMVTAINDAGESMPSAESDIRVYTSEFEKILLDGNSIPTNLDSYSAFTQSALGGYPNHEVAKVVYFTETGSGDGSSWSNAAGASDLKTTLDGLTDSEADKVSFLLVAAGNYATGVALKMKNRVAIVGGWPVAGGWDRSALETTTFDGNTSHRVFDNTYNFSTSLTGTALLHSVTVSNGVAVTDGGGMYNEYSSPTLIDVHFDNNSATSGNGGGMANSQASSPTLNNVVFSGNNATNGGGMANYQASPTLSNVTFDRNNANAGEGGGMANSQASSPTLNNVTFSVNEASGGGGMRNYQSSPILINVTFSGNIAGNNGGGISNIHASSPILINATFSKNKVSNNDGPGGGIYNNSQGVGNTITIVNSLFWGNMRGQTSETTGQQITNEAGSVKIRNSIVQHGIPSGSAVGSSDPKLEDLANNGGFIQTHAFTEGSPAINMGLYIKMDSNMLYYSENNSSWYSDWALTTSVTPSPDAHDLTIMDARGYARSGRPDIGAYEHEGTPSIN